MRGSGSVRATAEALGISRLTVDRAIWGRCRRSMHEHLRLRLRSLFREHPEMFAWRTDEELRVRSAFAAEGQLRESA